MYMYVYTLSSELEAVGEVGGCEGVTTSEAVIGDIYTQFTTAVQVFSSSRQVWHTHMYSLSISHTL